MQERCLRFNLYGLAISLAYPSGEEGGILLLQMISTTGSLRGGAASCGSIFPLEPNSVNIRRKKNKAEAEGGASRPAPTWTAGAVNNSQLPPFIFSPPPPCRARPKSFRSIRHLTNHTCFYLKFEKLELEGNFKRIGKFAHLYL